MICPICHGYRYIIHRRQVGNSTVTAHIHIPCPDCGGQGFGYCCEGMDQDLCAKETKLVSID